VGETAVSIIVVGITASGAIVGMAVAAPSRLWKKPHNSKAMPIKQKKIMK